MGGNQILSGSVELSLGKVIVKKRIGHIRNTRDGADSDIKLLHKLCSIAVDVAIGHGHQELVEIVKWLSPVVKANLLNLGEHLTDRISPILNLRVAVSGGVSSGGLEA